MLPFVDLLADPWRALAYLLCFLVGVVLLERGADWFIDAAARWPRACAPRRPWWAC
jgi:hypothetical protein